MLVWCAFFCCARVQRKGERCEGLTPRDERICGSLTTLAQLPRVVPGRHTLPMAAKQVAAKIRLLIGAGGAKPAPPVGPALGQAGLNIMSFCKDFNAATAGIKVSGVWGGVCVCVCVGKQHAVGETVGGREASPPPHSLPTQDGVPTPVTITAYKDKSYDYVSG